MESMGFSNEFLAELIVWSSSTSLLSMVSIKVLIQYYCSQDSVLRQTFPPSIVVEIAFKVQILKFKEHQRTSFPE